MSFTLALALLAASSAVPVGTPIETLIEAPGPSGPLRGTMLSPAAAPAAPVVLILPGSGATDRDGNNPAGVRGSTYRLIAEGLAARGVASVRIDKRGLFASSAAVPDPNKVTIADYAADVRSWTGSIRAKTGARCVWLLGHSEGGLIALVAARAPDVCGLILVSAGGRPIGTVMREQLRANPANAPLLGQAMAAIDALEAGRHVDIAGLDPALAPLFAPQVQDFLISLFSYDPARLIAGYDRPVLIVQGLRDIQVAEADARRLAQADPKARLVLLPDTNHVLKTFGSDDRAANFASYNDPSLPLAPRVAETIATFVAAGR
jgi:pimeloyl-ACP methyl ester carboxylesterase